MTMFLDQEERTKRMLMIERIKLEEDYNKARGENPYNEEALERYVAVARSTPQGKVVYVDDDTIIPLCDLRKGLFKDYEDMRVCFNRNSHIITEDEWDIVYMQSCVDAFDNDVAMEDYMEMLPVMEKSMEVYKENKEGCILYPFANTFYLLPDGSLSFVVTAKENSWRDDIHIIKNKMHLLSTPYGNAIRAKDYKKAGKELGKAIFGIEDSIEIIPCVVYDYMKV